MEYNCSTCKYSSSFEKSRTTLICNRVQPLIISTDDKILEYLVEANPYTKLVVFCEFCCIKWEPKEE